MKIQNLTLHNFMIFNEIETDFSPNINIISGLNSTGKTALLKLLYSSVKSINDAAGKKGEITKEQFDDLLVNKFTGVFRPEGNVIGRLVSRKQGTNKADIRIGLNDSSPLEISFGSRKERHVDCEYKLKSGFQPQGVVYIPPKEIISATENFTSLYDDYHIAIEEMYYDLARLLDKPVKKGPKSKIYTFMEKLTPETKGTIVKKGKEFYLNIKGQGEFEMGLVSEGYRKLATIMYLIDSGSLQKGSILFWDEPETNMNPQMSKMLIKAMTMLAQQDVQLFITTHDYFIQQRFNMNALYGKDNLKYKFFSLSHMDGSIHMESADSVSDLSSDPIRDEFDAIYNEELRMQDAAN